MRILTVISGMLLSIAGAFTLSFYTNAFAGLAFVLGLVMLISGLCTLISYLISGKLGRLPDTVLVEGMVTALFGFAVLNNEVMDAMISMFFGTWLTLAGVTRISQSFAVSRYRPRDWAKVMPLAIAASVLGLIMLMPSLTSYVNPIFFVGTAFIINGFSQLVYSMYMRRHKLTPKEIEAQERAEARRLAKEAERKERNESRSLSWHEKEEAREAQRRQERREAAERRASKMAELQKKREARRPASEMTVEFTAEETAQIDAAMAAEQPAPHPQQEEREKPEEAIAQPGAVYTAEASAAEGDAAGGSEDESLREAMEKAKPPAWSKPENIPSFRAKKLEEKAEAAPAEPQAPAESELIPAKRAAVNIEKIEEGLSEVEFEPVELPQPELASSGGEAQARPEIIEKLEEKVKEDDPFTPFEALKLEDLFGEDYVPLREKDPKEATRFTQSLNLEWTRS